MIFVFAILINVGAYSFDGLIQLQQNNRMINGSGSYFVIDDNKFNIFIKNVLNETIHIFAYHNNTMFTRYNYPIKSEETVMFHPATGLIDNIDENIEITLSINKEMQHNAITIEKRINEQNTAIVKIKDIADIDNKFTGTLYLTIFIDFNQNGVIESNEIYNLSIYIKKISSSILFRTRAYVSTIGGLIRDINYPVYSTNYFYVKITNESERKWFFKLFGPNYGDNTYFSDNRIRDADYLRYNMYIIFSPITQEIELFNNPYHYNGEYRLIFDTIVSNINLYSPL
jgi:hypothetical protein